VAHDDVGEVAVVQLVGEPAAVAVALLDLLGHDVDHVDPRRQGGVRDGQVER
jgi:hypothetical protein